MSDTADTADTATELYVALGRLVRAMRQHGGESPVGPGGYSAMVTLSRNEGGLRLGALAEAEGVSAPSMTRIVKVLQELSLIERRADEQDGRAFVVALTETGASLIASGQEARVTSLRARIDDLPADLRERLAAAVPALEALAGR